MNDILYGEYSTEHDRLGVGAFQKPPSPAERRLRNRAEMTEAILAAARVLMRRDGVAALNLHEIGRMVGLQTSALYKYFPSKAALYDELFRRGIREVSRRMGAVWADHAPGWPRLEAWAEARLGFAQENPDLEHLLFGRDVPGFVPSEASMEESRRLLEAGRRAFEEIVEAGVIEPGLPAARALDLFLAVTSGITGQHLANEPHLPAGQGRFGSLLPEAVRLFQAAWATRSDAPANGQTTGQGDPSSPTRINP